MRAAPALNAPPSRRAERLEAGQWTSIGQPRAASLADEKEEEDENEDEDEEDDDEGDGRPQMKTATSELEADGDNLMIARTRSINRWRLKTSDTRRLAWISRVPSDADRWDQAAANDDEQRVASEGAHKNGSINRGLTGALPANDWGNQQQD